MRSRQCLCTHAQHTGTELLWTGKGVENPCKDTAIAALCRCVPSPAPAPAREGRCLQWAPRGWSSSQGLEQLPGLGQPCPAPCSPARGLVQHRRPGRGSAAPKPGQSCASCGCEPGAGTASARGPAGFSIVSHGPHRSLPGSGAVLGCRGIDWEHGDGDGSGGAIPLLGLTWIVSRALSEPGLGCHCDLPGRGTVPTALAGADQCLGTLILAGLGGHNIPAPAAVSSAALLTREMLRFFPFHCALLINASLPAGIDVL